MAIERLFVGEGVKEMEVKKYLNKELRRAGLAAIVIQRTPLVTRIVLYCDRPALVIGRKGRNVKQVTKVIEEVYKIEKPELEIKKVENPNLEPNIVAYRIAAALERGMNPRKVGYKALQAIMREGAKGAEIIMSGKLVGKGGRARSLKMRAGYLKKCGQPSFVQVLHGSTIASCKPGIIGVNVSIVPQTVRFPDEIEIIKPEEFEVEETEEAKEEAPKEVEIKQESEIKKRDTRETPDTGETSPRDKGDEEKSEEKKKSGEKKKTGKTTKKAKSGETKARSASTKRAASGTEAKSKSSSESKTKPKDGGAQKKTANKTK